MTRADAVGLGVLSVCVGVAAWSGRVPAEGVAWRAVCVAAMVAAGGVSVWLASRGRLSARVVLLAALGLRLLAFPMLPSLSDDAYRYLWDGRLVVDGVSPYALLPDTPELAGFASERDNALLLDRMNSPGVYSVYPPLSQAVFAAAGLAPTWTAGWFVLKALLVLAELTGILCLLRVLRPGAVALYALHPLAVIEVAGQGHTEGLLVGAVGVAVWGCLSGWWLVAGLGVVAAGAVKLFPFAGLTLFVRRLRWRERAALGAATLTVLAALVPGDGLRHVLESLRLYGGALDFYSAPFLALKAAAYPLLGEGAGRAASVALSAAWILAILGCSVRCTGTPRSMIDGLLVVFVGYALVTPMLHPWNGLGALVLVPVMARRSPILWLLGVAPLTYMRYVGFEGLYGLAVGVGWVGAGLLLLRSVWASRSTVASAGESHV